MNTMSKDSSTHQFVDVQEIKDGVIATKNKELRAVLMVSSINFFLKSSDEKQAIILSFQRFLNSLRDYRIQIVVQSRPLDLSEYFLFVREHQNQQENELLQIQTAEYIHFVEELVELSNIMNKFFYVVVPYNLTVVEKKGILDKVLHRQKDDGEQLQLRFEEARDQLMLRVSEVASHLGEMGLRSILLGDSELVELFHGLYNPGTELSQENLELLIATGDTEKQEEEGDTEAPPQNSQEQQPPYVPAPNTSDE